MASEGPLKGCKCRIGEWREPHPDCPVHLPQQIDLDDQANPIPPDPPAPVDPGPPAVQLGLDVDVPVAIKLPGGRGVAYQNPLGG